VLAVDPGAGTVVARNPRQAPARAELSRDGHAPLRRALPARHAAAPDRRVEATPADRSADGIGVVDVASRKLIATFPSGQDPESFESLTDGKILLRLERGDREMTALDVVSGVVTGKAHVGREPEGVTVSPDGKVVSS